ncbi:MAG: hypothetical protein ACJ71G_00145 [Nitrososphaeraceae archaeon]
MAVIFDSSELIEFQKVLELAGLTTRKEDEVYKRHKVTFHSFRRFVRTTISNQTKNSDYSEWFLGHKKWPYYTNKPDELRSDYSIATLRFRDIPEEHEPNGHGVQGR